MVKPQSLTIGKLTESNRNLAVDLARLVDTQPEVIARFESKINHNGPVPKNRPGLGRCWIWTACTNGKPGYGLFRGGLGRDKYQSRRWVLAHRYAYDLYVGPIPNGYEPDHLCRNRKCVNPRHLEAVPHRVNTLRGESPPAKQSRRDHCIRGHPFDRVTPDGRRRCSICDKAKEDRRYIRRYGRVPKPRNHHANKIA